MSAYEGDLSQLVYELNSSTAVKKSDKKTSLDTLLESAAEQNASDVILVAGSAITLRVNGSIAPAPDTGTGQRTRNQPGPRLLFRSRINRKVPCQPSLSARHTRSEHPPPTRSNPHHRVSPSAVRPGAPHRTPPGSHPPHRPHRLRQDLHHGRP